MLTCTHYTLAEQGNVMIKTVITHREYTKSRAERIPLTCHLCN